MTEYTLLEHMMAEQLRAIAWTSASQMAHDLRALADAIDPPKPTSVITDEMVEAYAQVRRVVWLDFARRDLEVAVECGWTPPGAVIVCGICDGPMDVQDGTAYHVSPHAVCVLPGD